MIFFYFFPVFLHNVRNNGTRHQCCERLYGLHPLALAPRQHDLISRWMRQERLTAIHRMYIYICTFRSQCIIYPLLNRSLHHLGMNFGMISLIRSRSCLILNARREGEDLYIFLSRLYINPFLLFCLIARIR